MSEENKAMLRRIYDEVFGQGKLDVADEILAPDAVDHEDGSTGPDGLKRVATMFRSAFPDLSVNVHEIMDAGDKVVVRAAATGTHKGDFMGIAATGKRIEVEMIDIVRFEGGKAVEHWGITDTMSLMQQLGAVPEMGPG